VAEYGGEQIQRVEKSDIPAILQLYRSIQITYENYRNVLSPDGDESFRTHGGMFIVHNAESLKAEMANPRSAFHYAKYPGGAAAMLWTSTYDPGFAIPPQPVLDEAARNAGFREAMRGNTVIYAREHIVLPRALEPDAGGYDVSRAGRVLHHYVFAGLRARGYTHILAEIYCVAYYEDADGRHEVNVVNEAALHHLEEMGGVLIGENSMRKAPVEDGAVTAMIRPNIILLEIDRMLDVLSSDL
jgi:hypothetical protein